MLFENIKNEQHLRDWLSGQIIAWNMRHNDRVALEWIEPTFGSSMGISDCKITYKSVTFGVELKHWFKKRDGVCYKIRPVQRRYNFMGVRAGRKLLILASIDKGDYNELVAIRGDNVPLRDYCFILGSGCEDGIIQTVFSEDDAFASFLTCISADKWWS